MPFIEADITYFDTVFGRNLLAEVPHFVPPGFLPVTMPDLWPLFQATLPASTTPFLVETLDRPTLEAALPAIASTPALVGLGGGQALDVAKYFAWRLNRPLFQFPTSLSVDAVFGHRAAVREAGRVRYVGWAVPQTVYIDLDILEAAPRHLNIAGVGDVLCFLTGVMDWRHAATQGHCEARWPYDDALARISEARAEAILANLDAVRALSPRGIRLLVDGLQWGGASYHATGWNPRHIEGIEHQIFYALEAHCGKPFLHGQVVCLGLILGAMMHAQRVEELLAAITHLAIDIRPAALTIDWSDVRHALHDLKAFVGREQLPYGIAHTFRMTDAFLDEAATRIEEAYSS